MEFIKWADKYSVNHTLIDSQHKKLVEIMNKLHTFMRDGQGQTALQQVLDELITYTKLHFSTEETLMKKAGFAGYNEHKLEHDKLAEKVLAFQKDFKEGKTILTVDVMHFLQQWLVNHIIGSDKKYMGKLS